MTENKEISCPFCNESGFDMWGLKYGHLLPGWCPVFECIEHKDYLKTDDKMLKKLGEKNE